MYRNLVPLICIGQLTCIICDLPIKSEALWNAHIAGRVHKENALASKNKQAELNSSKTAIAGIKRKANSISEKSKLPKIEAEPIENSNDKSSDIAKPQQTAISSILTGYSSSSDEDEDKNEVESIEVQPSSVAANSSEDNAGKPENVPISTGPKSNSTKGLPEGFFDDPILDAKVRQVEYKNPMEEEWEKFQKTMAEETNLSQAIIEEDMQESNVEREIMEIDEQIHHWSKVEALLQQKDNLKKEKGKSEENSDESNSADEAQFDEFLDWRSKQAWKM